MASTKNMGSRKVSGNSMKPALAAHIKNAQGMGGGLKQAKGGAKFVGSAKPGRGVKQSNKIAARRVMGGKGQQAKVGKAQPKSPKGLTNNLVLANKVNSGDISRLQKAARAPMPKMAGGAFKAFIGGK